MATGGDVMRVAAWDEFTRSLPCAARSAAEARALVRAAFGAWGLEGVVDDGALLVSELVGNAAEHTRSRRIRVTVSRPHVDVVRISVVDRSGTMPVPRRAREEDQGGRGLAVVDALTTRWGVDSLAWGKRVWAELRSDRSLV